MLVTPLTFKILPEQSASAVISFVVIDFLFGLLTGGQSLRLLASIKQPSVTMKTRAKKASSDSENIQSAYSDFDIREFLYLQ